MKTIILVLVISLISFKGFSQKPFSYLRNKTKVDKIILLPPLTLINVINENGEEYYDSTLTHYTNRQVVNVLKSSFPDSVQISYIDFDSISNTNILSFIDGLNREIFFMKANLKSLKFLIQFLKYLMQLRQTIYLELVISELKELLVI